MTAGKYRVWAQGLGFETAKGEVDLSANKHQDLKLAAITDPEKRWRQLPGEAMWASLPEATPDDALAKTIIHNNCNGCHTPSYPLQFKFDEQGWTRIIDLMKVIGGGGVPLDRPANQVVERQSMVSGTLTHSPPGPRTTLTRVSSRIMKKSSCLPLAFLSVQVRESGGSGSTCDRQRCCACYGI